jgi:hypothetical protein
MIHMLKFAPFFMMLLMVHSRAAAADDPSLQLRVEQPLLSRVDTTVPTQRMYALSFDITVTNLGQYAANIPAPAENPNDGAGAFVLVIQARRADGSWRNLVQGDYFESPNSKHPACKPISPSSTTKVERISSAFTLSSSTIADIGVDPTLQVTVRFICRKPNGQVVDLTQSPAAFQVKIPTH